MFEAIVSKITTAVRTTVRAINTAVRRTSWVVPLAILALWLVMF